jgi:predicted dehydrogenase
MIQPAAQQFQFAQIGCGLIGRKRALALKRIPGAALRYACDLDAARAREVSQICPGCEAVTDFGRVLEDDSVRTVMISTINSALVPVAIEAVRAGKHVMIEKPGGIGAAQLRDLQTESAKTGARVRISYNHRFHPALQKAREIVESKALGPLMFLRGRYGHGGRRGYDREWRADPALSGGGELIDQGVHLIDLAGWFLGSFDKVEGHASTYFWDMKVDDNAFLSLRTPEGRTAWLQVSCTEWKNLFSFEIYGRDGKLSIEGLGGSYGVERLAYYKMLPEMGPPDTTVWEYPRGDDSWKLETEAFLDDIRLGRDPNPGLPQGIRTLEIVEEIYAMSGYPKL